MNKVVVNMHQAKSQLSKLVERACKGDEVIIARNGEPLVRLTPVEQHDGLREPPARFAGRITLSSDFNDPLPPEYEGYE